MCVCVCGRARHVYSLHYSKFLGPSLVVVLMAYMAMLMAFQFQHELVQLVN